MLTAFLGCEFDSVEGGFAVTRAGLYELGDLSIDQDIEFWASKRRRQVCRGGAASCSSAYSCLLPTLCRVEYKMSKGYSDGEEGMCAPIPMTSPLFIS
jgi:hypothetical protein